MRKMIERVTETERREVFVNQNEVESVTPLVDGFSQVRMRGGIVYQVVGEPADVAAFLESPSQDRGQVVGSL